MRRRRSAFSLGGGFVSLFLGALLWGDAEEVDVSNAMCKMLRLDELKLSIPPDSNEGVLKSVSLIDDRDLTPLVESDDTLGTSTSLVFEEYVSDPACTITSISIFAQPTTLEALHISTPPAPPPYTTWATLSIPIPHEAYVDPEKTAWADLTRFQLAYSCQPAERKAKTAYVKIQLMRVCKELPGPNYCLVKSTDTYKTNGHDCQCQTCHSCKCLIQIAGRCQYESCEPCICAPFCKCCYEYDCSYECNCSTCYDSLPFSSCSKLIRYGVSKISPSAGLEAGGTPVLVTSTTSFISTPHMSYRFGKEVVPAAFVSPTRLQCVTPPWKPGQNRTVGVSVTLDGQKWTTEKVQYRFCAPTDNCPSCESGWKGKNCTVECQGGALNPCNGRGTCLDDPPGACACEPGFSGRACQLQAGELDSSSLPLNDKGGSMKEGVIVGIVLSVMVALILGAVMYYKRAEVLEYVFWTLAATRFQRLHQTEEHEEGEHEVEDMEDHSGSGPGGPPPLGAPPPSIISLPPGGGKVTWKPSNNTAWSAVSRTRRKSQGTEEEEEEDVLLVVRQPSPATAMRRLDEQEEVEMTIM